MFKDAYENPLQMGDTVLLKDGCLCLVIDFVTYEMAVEVLLEDKLTHNFRTEQPRNLMKIS